MHVVVLAEFATPSGGAEKVALESARGLADLGLAVSYLQGVSGPADPLLDHPRIRRIDLGLPDIWSRGAVAGAVSGIWHRAAAERVRAALAALPPADIVHLHQWTRTFSSSVFPVLRVTGIPVLVTLHDYALACPNGVYYRFDRAEPCSLRPMSPACIAAPCDSRSRLHKLVRVARSAVLRRVLGGRPLHLVHVCDASRARMAGLFDGAALHHRLDNPVRVLFEAPVAPERGDAVVYLGRLTREKGADLVATAARTAGLPALFIGTGPLEAELRAGGAELLGWQAPEAARAILRRRARALAAPSRWYETGPLTVYEALAAGIPVVASERSGAAEKVRDAETGFVVAPETGALARAFALLRDDARVAGLGRAAHARFWSAPTTLASHARAAADLYARILSGGSVPTECALQHERAGETHRTALSAS